MAGRAGVEPDPEYVRLHTGFGLSGTDDGSPMSEADLATRLALAEKVAQRVTAQTNGAKVVINRRSVVFSVEQVVAAPSTMPHRGHLAAVLPRMRMMLEHAITSFYNELDDCEQLAGIEAATHRGEAEAGETSRNRAATTVDRQDP